jgi:hypothetical protein
MKKLFLATALAAVCLTPPASGQDATAAGQDIAARNRQAAEMEYEGPADILRSARVLLVRSRSRLFETEVFEREILKRSEKENIELFITRDESQAELIVDVHRKKFSTRFVFMVIEPKTKLVVASDKSSSLGGDIEPDLANLLVRKFKAARQH